MTIAGRTGHALRVGVVLAALLGVAGCRLALPEAGQTEARALAAAKPVGMAGLAPPPREIRIAGSAITVSGPRGFCIDRAATSGEPQEQAVVVLSSCRELGSGFLAHEPEAPAILTAAVAPDGTRLDIVSSADQMRAFFATERGRAALSRESKAATVTVMESFLAEDAYFLRLSDSAPFPGGDVSRDYWRAILAVDGRVLTASVYGTGGGPLARNDGIRLLRSFVLAIRESSAKG